jgi:Fe-S-cluster containining protein
MRCLHCGACCEETEMLLSNEDIERLQRKGYNREFFVRIDEEGYAVLRNQNGYCVFFDSENRVCRERANRPSGCRIYPVIQDENKGIIVDSTCPAQTTVSEKQRIKRGKKVLKLLEKIDAEANERRFQ